MGHAGKLVYLAAAALLLVPGLTSAAPASSCSVPWVSTVAPQGEPHLCEYDLQGDSEHFACQVFQGRTGRYVAAYRGGRSPEVIFAVGGEGRQAERALWVKGENPGEFNCVAEPPPAGVPAGAKYLATGVCESIDGDIAPCRMYRHAGARQYKIQRYLVLYDPAGGGTSRVETHAEGVNHDALTAELAYQLGVSLLQTDCCKARGESYIAYAYQMFPREAAYRAQYLSGSRLAQEFAAETGR